MGRLSGLGASSHPEAESSLGLSSKRAHSSHQTRSWPAFEEDEIKAVTRVLKSGRVNAWTGEEVAKFEAEFAKFTGAQYAVAFANGSLALEAAWACLDQERVTIPCRTFVATAWSAYRAGKRVEYVDVDEDGLAAGDVTCTVHLGGKVSKVRAQIEDCAQAMGATYEDGAHVGTKCKIGVFSFCQDKIMTTGGEGGMCVTYDYLTYRKLWAWKDHGKNYEKSHTQSHGNYNWCHTTIGTNARMTEMQAAIGRVQLRKVNAWVARRREIAMRMQEGLKNLPSLRVPYVTPNESCYRFYVYLVPEAIRDCTHKDRILWLMEQAEIPCGVGSCPEVYREQAVYSGNEHCPKAKELGLTSLCFKIHHRMSNPEVDRIIKATRKILKGVTRV